jgi:hypothetical protein
MAYKTIHSKNINYVLIIGGIIMMIIGVILIFKGEKSIETYGSIFAGLMFSLSGYKGLKSKPKENIIVNNIQNDNNIKQNL